jgi:hypothetical protein
MKKVIVALIMFSGVAAVTFAALDSSSASKNKNKALKEKKEEKKEKKKSKRSCSYYG